MDMFEDDISEHSDSSSSGPDVIIDIPDDDEWGPLTDYSEAVADSADIVVKANEKFSCAPHKLQFADADETRVIPIREMPRRKSVQLPIGANINDSYAELLKRYQRIVNKQKRNDQMVVDDIVEMQTTSVDRMHHEGNGERCVDTNKSNANGSTLDRPRPMQSTPATDLARALPRSPCPVSVIPAKPNRLHPVGRSSTKSHARLAQYNEKSESLETFFARFENFSKYFGWTEEDRLFNLINRLGDVVGSVLWDGGEQETSADLINLLKSRHGSDNQCERFRMELKALHRKPGESLQSVYQEVKRLTALAHSKATGKVVETIAIDAFVDALQDRDLRKQILQCNCATLDAALMVAMRIEAIDRTSPPLNIIAKQAYGADGVRIDRAHVRGVTAEETVQVEKREHPIGQIDLEYYRAQVTEANPDQMRYHNYQGTQGYQNQRNFYQPQTPQQPPRFNFQTPPQNAQGGGTAPPQFRPRGRGNRIPREQIQCYKCNTYGHYKWECPYLVVQQPQGQGGGANANAVYYALQQQQQQVHQNSNWQQ